MIFVASGTQDGRGLVEYLLKQNYKVMASVVTNYGKELLPKDENLIINDHKLDEEAMKNCLKENQIKVFFLLNIENNHLLMFYFQLFISIPPNVKSPRITNIRF